MKQKFAKAVLCHLHQMICMAPKKMVASTPTIANGTKTDWKVGDYAYQEIQS